MSKLNFPYYIYPGTPYCEYTDVEQYNENILQLNDLLLNLSCKINDPILLHFTIGSPMENILNSNFQWQQLFPIHVRNFIKNNNIKNQCIHIIISPDSIFSSKNNVEPKFIKETTEFDWLKQGNNYISLKYNYKVIIFNTMMPTYDNRNNDYINKFININNMKLQYNINFNKYIQTEFDIKFIHDFYNNFNKCVTNITQMGGIITCFSFAVFNAESNKNNINKYAMFKEIINIFNNKQTLLAEWIFYYENYLLVPNRPESIGHALKYEDFELDENLSYCVHNIKNGISYVTYDNIHNKGKHISIYDVEESNKLYYELI
jgi:hypothetical protein